VPCCLGVRYRSPWKSLGNPDFDACKEQTKRKKEPRNSEHDRLQIANGWAVAADGRIRTEKLSPMTPGPGAGE